MAQTAQAFVEAESYRRAVADHRLQPLHRARLRHGAGRVAAEAGRGFRRLAAVPVRSAPDSARAKRRCTWTTVRRRRRSPTTCATNRASGWSSAPIPPATRCSSRSRRRQPNAGIPSTSNSSGMKVPAFETTEQPASAATPRRSDGSQHDLPREAPAPSAGRRRRTARRRSRHRQGARRRRRGDAGAPLAVRRGNRRRADGRLLQPRRPQGCVQRSQLVRAGIRDCQLGPDEYLEHLRQVKQRGRDSGHRVAQRRHRGRLDLLREAARRRRRGRPRAAPVSRRQRHDA